MQSANHGQSALCQTSY